MKLWKIFSVCLALITALTTAYSKNVLVVSNVPSISHSIFFRHLAYTLSSAGHKVVLLDTVDQDDKVENVTTIFLDGGYIWRKPLDESIDSDGALLYEMSQASNPLPIIKELADLENEECHSMLLHPTFKKFLKEYRGKKMDLIVMDFICESFYALVPIFGNPPFVIATAYADPSRLLHYVGHYDNPSYVPLQLSSFPQPMNFYQRFLNTWYHLYEIYIDEFYMRPEHNRMAKEVFGKNIPTIEEIIPKITLFLANTNKVMNGVKALPPAVIPIGGVHVNMPPKPLPPDMKKFLDGATNGAVVLSFGSNVPSASMSPEKRRVFMKVFGELPQRVLWKFETNKKEDIPPNVMITKWLPQGDVLGHPNVVCFISHGGLLGTQESVVRGVPVLGVPFMFDQFDVMDKLERQGVAITLQYPDINEQNLRDAIQALSDPNGEYQKNMKEYSAAFNDEPDTPKQRALFWMEYAMRHGGKTDFLKPVTVKMPRYQILLLDITMAFLVGFILVVTVASKILLSLKSLLMPATRKIKSS